MIGNDSTGHKDYKPGLVRHDLRWGAFWRLSNSYQDSSGPPDGLAVHDGKLISSRCRNSPGLAE